jgi:hypothetical protein
MGGFVARTRQIKPDAFDDADLNALAPLTRWFFAGLWTQADKKGRLEDDPRRLKVRLLAYDADADVDAILDGLQTAGMIRRYEVAGKRYVQVVHFLKHQNPHPKEQESSIPEENTPSRVITRQSRVKVGPCRVKDSTCRVITPDPDPDPESGSLYQSSDSGGIAALAPDSACIGRPDEVLTLWTTAVNGSDVPTAQRLSPSRTKAIRLACQEHPTISWWGEYFVRIMASDFLTGRAPRDPAHANWRPDLDWALKSATIAKVCEGKYDNRENGTRIGPAYTDWTCEHDPRCGTRRQHEDVLYIAAERHASAKGAA